MYETDILAGYCMCEILLFEYSVCEQDWLTGPTPYNVHSPVLISSVVSSAVYCTSKERCDTNNLDEPVIITFWHSVEIQVRLCALLLKKRKRLSYCYTQ